MSYSCFTDEEMKDFLKKKDIFLYKNNLNNIWNFKSDKAYRELLLAIVDFVNGKKEFPKFTDTQAEATFEIIKSNLIENALNYSLKCSTNRENAKKRDKTDRNKNPQQMVQDLANNMSMNNDDNMLDEQLKKKGRTSFMNNDE